MIEPGAPAPEFTLPDHRGQQVSLGDFRGRKLVLCFYPNDFSPVCSDQLSVYQGVLPQIAASGTELVGISTDGSWCHNAFRKHLGLEMTLLADFHPKGEVSRAYGAYLEDWGTTNRSLVLIDADGIVRWVHAEETPLTIPGANLIFDALEALGGADTGRDA
jgi:peroxiredoxin